MLEIYPFQYSLLLLLLGRWELSVRRQAGIHLVFNRFFNLDVNETGFFLFNELLLIIIIFIRLLNGLHKIDIYTLTYYFLQLVCSVSLRYSTNVRFLRMLIYIFYFQLVKYCYLQQLSMYYVAKLTPN